MASTLFLEPGASEEGSCFLEEGVAQKQQPRWRDRKALTGGIIASFAVLVLLATSLDAPRGAGVEQNLRDRVVLDSATQEKCHTAKAGEACHVDVMWAKSTGIRQHPDWYEMTCPSLKPQAGLEEFQACVYKINQTTCPLPCNPAATIPQHVVHQTHRGQQKPEVHVAPCHTATKGEKCYDYVLDSMLRGIDERPQEYPGLSRQSSFEDFQAALSKAPNLSNCPAPCTCHTAVAGESCFKHVTWAMGDGLHGHKRWYVGLSENATFEEVQAYLRKDEKHNCPMPCSAVGSRGTPNVHLPTSKEDGIEHLPTSKEDAIENFEKEAEQARQDAKGKAEREGAEGAEQDAAAQQQVTDIGTGEPGTGSRAESHSVEHEWVPPQPLLAEEQPCHTTAEGEDCHNNVMFGMRDGIYGHPEWYPNLTEFSSLEEFQAVLHNNAALKCAKPCPCHTAREGEECHSSIKWVIREGLSAHPDWYEGLTVRSRFEDVQRRLHEDEQSPCQVPCTAPAWGTPSLFCFSVFRSQGYELDLVRAQVGKSVGIFKCDEFAVLSDQVLDVAKGIKTSIIPPCEAVGVSKDGTAANTLIFMQAWSVIYNDVRWRAHDWTIKADPDAVIMVDRMRTHLAPHTGKNVWMTNCMKYEGPGWPMMFGSLEAFSNEAMETYYKGAERCKSELQWQAWGEDLFMGNCLSMLGATSVFDGGLIGDNVCKGANCADGWAAAYHPFKSAEAWFECYNTAMR